MRPGFLFGFVVEDRHRRSSLIQHLPDPAISIHRAGALMQTAGGKPARQDGKFHGERT
jgi:hypothetical protein